MTRTRNLVLMLAALASAPAWSATPFYVGLRAGSNLDGRLDDQGGNIDTDNPYGGYAGWRINDTFALELGHRGGEVAAVGGDGGEIGRAHV